MISRMSSRARSGFSCNPQNEQATIHSDTFHFIREKPKHRITVLIAGFKAEQSGQVIVESRIRCMGRSDWLSQSYAIDVLVHPVDGALPPPADEQELPAHSKTEPSPKRRRIVVPEERNKHGL